MKLKGLIALILGFSLVGMTFAQTKPILKVATNHKMPPFAMVDGSGNLEGIDIETIKAIADELGYTTEFTTMPLQNLFQSVVDKQQDLAISGISWTQGRADKYGLSKRYLFVPAAALCNSDNLGIKQVADLADKNVGGIESSAHLEKVKALGGTGNIIGKQTIFLSFKDLITKSVDCIIEDQQVLEYLKNNYPQYQLVLYPYEDESVPGSAQIIMIRKDNADLVNKVNSAIDKLTANGRIEQIQKKWIKR